ncbi:hypothetical protein RRG08_034389 [Elysia crispata]|uniref:Uncharacterized protein n=1 Tax=Elysia crispata TaxID=231223 RepID=A0AAE1CX92_9GAST|nr:hypothetical protein RRG08_034389 [Elysia crispata]
MQRAVAAKAEAWGSSCMQIKAHDSTKNRCKRGGAVVQPNLGRKERERGGGSRREPPCERHFFLDFAVFNPQTLTLMLQEVHSPPTESTTSEGEITLLIQLPLSSIPDSQFIKERPSTYSEGCNVEPFNRLNFPHWAASHVHQDCPTDGSSIVVQRWTGQLGSELMSSLFNPA